MTSRATSGWPRAGRTLLVASTGRPSRAALPAPPAFRPALDDVEWATFDTGQSRHLLADETVHLRAVRRPKDAKGTSPNAARSHAPVARGRFARVISTGAAVALPFLARARTRGLAAHYIESAARSDGPSLTGRMVSRIPGVRLYGQYPVWAGGPLAVPRRGVRRLRAWRLVRTSDGVRESSSPSAPSGASAFAARPSGSPGAAGDLRPGRRDPVADRCHGHDRARRRRVDTVPAADLKQPSRKPIWSSSHAGVGTALLTLEHGQCPVLLPRRTRSASTPMTISG